METGPSQRSLVHHPAWRTVQMCSSLVKSAGWLIVAITVNSGNQSMAQPTNAGQADSPSDAAYSQRRLAMVRSQLKARDIRDVRVLEVMGHVPRHRFVIESQEELAYTDQALPIDHGQTISQPYIVALMTQLAQPRSDSKALDIGTGSGYQAAVLSGLCARVFSIEIVKPLADQARQRLETLGYKNVVVRHGDGYAGWPDESPFDLIIVAAAPERIPPPLIDQLARGGRLVIPVGDRRQHLMVVEKDAEGRIRQWRVAPVAFVPMTGRAQENSP